MIGPDKKIECTACGACVNICPKKAIHLHPDENGFLYPDVDTDKCIDCSLCNSVCQIERRSEKKSFVQGFFALANKNKEHLKVSSSGGAFLAVAKYIFEKGGAVVGCAFDKDQKAYHTVTYSLEDCIDKLCGSKYVQSETLYTYTEVKELLEGGRYVLYVGTPCQIEGLLLFLQNKPDNLITLDLICHGVSSPLLWEKHKNYLESKLGQKINEFRFRSKTQADWSLHYHYRYGNKNAIKHGPSVLDKYYTDFSKALNYRESCYQCRYANLNRMGDITIGDFWGARKCVSEVNVNEGISLIIVNTELGDSVIKEISDKIFLKEIPLEIALEKNHNLSAPTPRPPQRDDYYSLCFADFEKWENDHTKTKTWKIANLKNKVPYSLKKILKK